MAKLTRDVIDTYRAFALYMLSRANDFDFSPYLEYKVVDSVWKNQDKIKKNITVSVDDVVRHFNGKKIPKVILANLANDFEIEEKEVEKNFKRNEIFDYAYLRSDIFCHAAVPVIKDSFKKYKTKVSAYLSLKDIDNSSLHLLEKDIKNKNKRTEPKVVGIYIDKGRQDCVLVLDMDRIEPAKLSDTGKIPLDGSNDVYRFTRNVYDKVKGNLERYKHFMENEAYSGICCQNQKSILKLSRMQL